MTLPTFRSPFCRLALAWAGALLALAPASAQTLSPDFNGPGLTAHLVPYVQPGFTYTTQGGTLRMRYDTVSGATADANGAVQWNQVLLGDFTFRATVDITGLDQQPGPAFMNAGPYLSFASGATVLVGPWKDGAGASLNGGYTSPGYVGATVYTLASQQIDIVYERRGNTITEWAGVAGSGNLQPLLTVTGTEFSGPAYANFFLYVRQPGAFSQGTVAFTNVSVTPVPEPASLALWAVGAAALARVLRQRQKDLQGVR